jgi:hypothetical protein
MTRLLLLGFGMGLAFAVPAQTRALVDPTRPPNVSEETSAGEATIHGPRLQSVLISPTRRAAVISGTAVALGGRFGDATLEEVTESAVVLRYADRRETLQLLPGQDKRERSAAAMQKGTVR